MSGCMQNAVACACATVFPQPVCNQAGLPAIAYRIGDYLSIRERLLQPLPGETALAAWQPGASGDLAVQMMEWAAYLDDILTFYNERIANEAYLGTALLPQSVNHLVQLLGYRPRPALGARVQLAGLLSKGALVPVSVPKGLQVQSKPAPGQLPQLFELDAPASLQAPDVISAVASPAQAPLLSADGGSLWLAGKVTGIKAGDRLLLTNAQAITAQTMSDYAWINVTGTSPQTDPLGNSVTSVGFTTVASTLAGSGQAGSYLLLRSGQSAPLWPYGSSNASAPVIAANTADLAGPARGITAGSVALFDVADAAAGLSPTLVLVSAYAETVWFANGNGGDPTAPPAAANTPAVPIPHAHLQFTPALGAQWSSNAGSVTLRFAWTPVGQLVPVQPGAASLNYTGGNGALVVAAGAAAFPTTAVPVLLEDPLRNGASAVCTPVAGTPGAVTLGQLSTLPAAGLASPVDVLFNLMPFSRGKTVASEVLGSGNPSVAGQDFTLAQSPVTYQADPASVSGNGFSSTVRVSVNGVQWQEVQSFYGQTPNAQVFVLYEDDAGSTHVTFGDGANGARLPTGTNNVVATYRTGAGAQAPAAETLTVVQTPSPGLKGVRNPLPPTGGMDADPQARLSSLAPASVLTFNRAVALDDYAAIAATAAGVTQAVAGYMFDPVSQRPVVALWIAGDADAVAQAGSALAGIAMPNQGLRIKAATPIESRLGLTYVRDPRTDDATVQAALTTALLDPDAGLLGTYVLGIGQAVYESQIAQACLAVPGVTAIHDVSFKAVGRFIPFILRWSGGRFAAYGQAAQPAPCSGQRFDPGAGNYFSVPDDGQHLTLNGAAAS